MKITTTLLSLARVGLATPTQSHAGTGSAGTPSPRETSKKGIPHQLAAVAGVLILLGTFGCASMDTDVKSMRGPAYGQPPRVALGDVFIIRDPAELAGYEYDVVGSYIVEETPQVIMSVSADEMLNVAARRAWKDGADAVVVDDFGSKNVAGGYARTTPTVKIRGIRFRGAVPQR